jgi:hypothetical protein
LKPSFWLNFTTLDWLMPSAGQLLGRVVAQQVGVVEDEVGDAALDGRHLPALGTDLQQGRHAGCPGMW